MNAAEGIGAKLNSVGALVAHLQLRGFHTYELNATAADEFEPGASAPNEKSEDAEGGVEAIRLRTAIRARDRGLDFRVEVQVTHSLGTLTADMAAMYDADIELEVDDDVVVDFGDGVAMMMVYPYLRQAIGDLAVRTGVQVTLPIVYPGQLSFRKDDAGNQSDEHDET